VEPAEVPVAEPVSEATPEVPAARPAEEFAYEPEPSAVSPSIVTPSETVPVAGPSAMTQPTSLSRPAPVEAEPIDLLALTGAKGMFKRAAPVLILVAVIIIALLVWLIIS
jgi:hypothetical protein